MSHPPATMYREKAPCLHSDCRVQDKYFHFNCFNVEDADDPSVGLINGELAIPGILLRREVFDPVIDEVSAQVTVRRRHLTFYSPRC